MASVGDASISLDQKPKQSENIKTTDKGTNVLIKSMNNYCEMPRKHLNNREYSTGKGDYGRTELTVNNMFC